LLVKPQFEVGRDRIGKKGVVRDTDDQAETIEDVITCAIGLGWHYHGLTWSPITGPAGNIEFLLWLKDDEGQVVPTRDELRQLTKDARSAIDHPEGKEESGDEE
jgi:23S rRNA (cytidine1920-2'-O)/16S rRNA (cytidine1409-2'-O)-methyltransferase